jgi:lipoate-protein ligase B
MEFKVIDLGLVDFQVACQRQTEIFNQVKSGAIFSALIICRHNPVITMGRSATRKNITSTASIPIYEVERGGDVTYHGPGQLTVYPIVNLEHFKKDLHWFLRGIEEAIINFLADYGINGERRRGLTGVWVGEKKIASIGIAVRSWITFYGLSINIKKDDLENFRLIRPCGMDIEMTSLETLLANEVDIAAAKTRFIANFTFPEKIRKKSP